MNATREQTFFAEFALAVTKCERCQYVIAFLHGVDLLSDILNDAHPLVPGSESGLPIRFVPAVEPKIGTADACVRYPDDSVGRILNCWIRNLFDADISFAMINGSFHGAKLRRREDKSKELERGFRVKVLLNWSSLVWR
jgi:hypothetical protein